MLLIYWNCSSYIFLRAVHDIEDERLEEETSLSSEPENSSKWFLEVVYSQSVVNQSEGEGDLLPAQEQKEEAKTESSELDSSLPKLD